MMTTTHAYRDYVFRIEYEPKEPAYTVEFVDIPKISPAARRSKKLSVTRVKPWTFTWRACKSWVKHCCPENTGLS